MFNLNPNLFSLVSCPWIYHPVPRLPLSSLHNRLPNPFPAALNPHESHGMLSIFSWVGHPPFQVCVFKLLRLLSNQLRAPASFPLTDRTIGQNIGVIFNSVLPFISSTPTCHLHSVRHCLSTEKTHSESTPDFQTGSDPVFFVIFLHHGPVGSIFL